MWRLCLLVWAAAALPAKAVTGPEDFDGPTDVTLFLFTQKKPEPEYIVMGDASQSPSFDPGHPTRLLIHGGRTGARAMERVLDAYLATGKDYNVVVVDWSGVAALKKAAAMQTSILVADYVGRAMSDMAANRGLDLNKLYIVGHSMGGQLAGIVGNRLGGAAAHVVALDPASDIYDDNPMENQLDASDAQFVQIIHTNGPGLGIADPRGTVDFIVNNGSYQPGCDGWTGRKPRPPADSRFGPLLGPRPTRERKQGVPRWPFKGELCSHIRALKLYVESISSHALVASKCDNYELFAGGGCGLDEHAVMGEDAPKSISGTFYLKTNKESPFGLGHTDL